MRIAEINVLNTGSTGNIMIQIANQARNNGYDVQTYSPVFHKRSKKIQSTSYIDHFFWGNERESFFHFFAGTILGRNGLYSRKGTRQLIKKISQFKPDIIHLHNLHAYCINLPILFKYIKKNNIKVIWTLHDCWSFTGHCPHFVMAGCNKWKTECHHCPQPKVYPKMYVDTSRKMYRLKKKLYSDIKDLTIVTPSKWLADLVSESFMKDHPIKVINNGIDLSVFRPTKGGFRKEYNLEEKKIILGVASDWGKRKGLDVFIELSKRLPEEYQIVLVGLDNTSATFPKNITTIKRTANQSQLAEIYTAADLFVNPTREDTFPTVNIEALACGTPVLTFNTGGSPEIIDESCGMVVDVDDVDSMTQAILNICTAAPYTAEACLNRASRYDKYERYKDYVKLYSEV